MRQKLIWTILFTLLAMSQASMAIASEKSEWFEHLSTFLLSKKFTDKSQAVELLSNQGGQQSQDILSALLNSKLYYLKHNKRLVFVDKQDGQYTISGVLDKQALGPISKSKIKKITLNNKLRRQIRYALTIMDIRSPNAEKRLAAVNQMLDRPDASNADMLLPLLEVEQNEEISEVMQTVIALGHLVSDDKSKRITAVNALEGNTHPAVHNGLKAILASTEDKDFAAEIQAILANIEDKLKLYSLIENTFFGLSLGSVLVLAAIGLAITFGVMGVINMAHGELIMIGAYTTYVIQLLMPNHIGISVLVAIPAAFIVSGLVGIAIERGIIRHLYGRPLETLLATFGISLILQQAVRSIFSPLNRSVEIPSWMSGSLEINSALSLTFNRLYIIAFCLIVFAALFVVLKKTTLGLQVRAVSQNRSMARAMGVRSEWVDAMTFGLGSGIAGVAGVALSQLTNVGPNLGQTYIIDSFMVVVFGGVGNLWGTLVSGMSLGVANKFLEPWSGAVLAKILVLVFIILFIQKRPRGLFPQKGRTAED